MALENTNPQHLRSHLVRGLVCTVRDGFDPHPFLAPFLLSFMTPVSSPDFYFARDNSSSFLCCAGKSWVDLAAQETLKPL